MKLKSLIKASFTEGMSLFKFKNKKSTIFPFVLALILMLSIYSLYDMLAGSLKDIGLTNLVLGIALILPVFLTFIESIYKAQGLLYECKDNNLLLSLPITKKEIVFIRILKVYVFEFLYTALFALPAFVVYAVYNNPGISFYLLSILELILLPIVPLVIGSFIAYIIKSISSKFKMRKLFQTIFTFLIFFLVYFLSSSLDSFLPKLASKASSINDLIIKIYYPIGSYLVLIDKFNILEFIKLLLVNIIPFLLFIYIISLNYFKVIYKENKTTIKKHKGTINYKRNSIVSSLIKKDIKKYFSSPVYIFNTMFGLILLIISTIALSINFKGAISLILSNEISDNTISDLFNMAPVVYMMLLFTFNMITNISASSISIEGKTFSITKSMPIKEEKYFLSKILSSMIICMPFIIVSDLIFIISMKPSLIYILYILLISIIAPLLSSIIGLLCNLYYPKMNASNDTEVVKQSASAMISIISGMVLSMIFICSVIYSKLNILLLLLIEISILTIIIIILSILLKTIGIKKYHEILN